MPMTYEENSDILAADGEQVGTLRQLVIDPKTRAISHLIVEQGTLFKEAKVIPVEFIAGVNGDQIRLTKPADDLHLEPFEERHYIPSSAPTDMQPHVDSDVLYAHIPSVAMKPWQTPYYTAMASLPEAMESEETSPVERNIPDKAVTLHEDATVYSFDGENVGTVSEFVVAPETQQVSHIVIEQGFFSPIPKQSPLHGLVVRVTKKFISASKPPHWKNCLNTQVTLQISFSFVNAMTIRPLSKWVRE